MRSEIKKRILEQKDLASRQAHDFLHAASLSEKEVLDYVHNYICYKFYLNPEDMHSISLFQMAKLSVEHSIQMQLPLAKEGEVATTCGAAASEAMKIALLLTALQKDFHIHLDPSRLGFAKTTQEVGAMVWEVYQKNHSDREK